MDPELAELLGETPSAPKPRRYKRGRFTGNPLPAWALKSRDELPTQAHRVIAKFGGPAALARAIGYDRSQVYRWMYQRDWAGNGTNGVIPAKALQKVLQVARAHGVVLTKEDLDPRPYKRVLRQDPRP